VKSGIRILKLFFKSNSQGAFSMVSDPKDGSIRSLLQKGENSLLEAGIEESREETLRILEVLGISRTSVYLGGERKVSEEEERRFLKIVGERMTRRPLAYILGETCFREETLWVNEHCLIPRPETEILVEKVIAAIREKRQVFCGSPAGENGRMGSGGNPTRKFSFLDIGTGTGAIAISLLRTFLNAEGTLLDISREAIEVARRNVQKYGLEGRARLIPGDFFKLSQGPAESDTPRFVFDVIVSNPPYLSELDLQNIQPELKYEPREALDGGKDGLHFYRRLIPLAKGWLRAGGLLALEVGAGQSGMVSKWLQDAGYDSIHRFEDYLGIERVVTAWNDKRN